MEDSKESSPVVKKKIYLMLFSDCYLLAKR